MDHKIKMVLRLLAVGIVAVGLWQWAPRLLEQQGLYFGKSAYQAEAEERMASLPIQYVGPDACFQCHQSQHDEWQETNHLTVGCETCHGPGRGHIDGEGKPSFDTSREACGVCHDELDARPGDFPQVSLVQHNSQSSCTACHNPMGAASWIPHFVEEGTDCLFCHGLQGIKPFPESHAGRSGEVCHICHKVSPILPTSTATPPGTTPTAPPAGTVEPASPPGVPHSLEGRSECIACHGPAGFKPFPADHAGRAGDLCLACHEREGS